MGTAQVGAPFAMHRGKLWHVFALLGGLDVILGPVGIILASFWAHVGSLSAPEGRWEYPRAPWMILNSRVSRSSLRGVAKPTPGGRRIDNLSLLSCQASVLTIPGLQATPRPLQTKGTPLQAKGTPFVTFSNSRWTFWIQFWAAYHVHMHALLSA